MATFTQAQLHAVVNTLQGSAGTLRSALATHGLNPELEDDYDFCTALDDLIFCCSTCDWWCELSEKVEAPDGSWNCETCTGDEDGI